jgi:putative endonuclease
MSEIFSLYQNDSGSADPRRFGASGEDLAARFLLKNGYRIVLANFKAPIGRNRLGVAVTGEIDVIAFDENVLCFIEVKTRRSDEFSSALSAVDLRKQRQIIRTAKVYRRIFRVSGIRFRYDVVTAVLTENERPRIELFKSFWTEDKFQKKSWEGEFR